MVWDIPSPKQQKDMTFCRAQCLLFKRINQSNKSSGNRKFLERYIYVSKDPQNHAGLNYLWYKMAKNRTTSRFKKPTPLKTYTYEEKHTIYRHLETYRKDHKHNKEIRQI